MRTRLLLLITLLVTTGLCVAAGELLVRLSGHAPARFLLAVGPDLPVIHEPVPGLGWRSKAGAHIWPGRGRDLGSDIAMTFWPGGLRATSAERVAGRRRVVLVGGSFMQGWAVTNEETCGWKLQEALPELELLNLGTAGYGTYQSLLALEGLLDESSGQVAVVVYGFNDFHATRNVASGSWLRSVSGTSRAGRLRVPYATLAADGSLLRHPAEPAPAWPFRQRLALAAFLEARYTNLRTRARTGQAFAVTEALLLELDRVARESGAWLLTAALSPTLPRYKAMLRQHRIAHVSCIPPSEVGRTSVPGYGHPGRKRNAWWAKCIERRLGKMGLRGGRGGVAPVLAGNCSECKDRLREGSREELSPHADARGSGEDGLRQHHAGGTGRPPRERRERGTVPRERHAHHRERVHQ